MDTVIAVIDTDETILDALTLLLQHKGWDIQTYTSGEAFLEDRRRHPPDCVVLEPYLRGLCGADVAIELINDRPPVPVIGLTARPDGRCALRMLEAGAKTMLTKPAAPETLIAHIESALRD